MIYCKICGKGMRPILRGKNEYFCPDCLESYVLYFDIDDEEDLSFNTEDDEEE